MDPLHTFSSTAQELVSAAREHGIDLEPFRHDYSFFKSERFIYLWRKDALPGTGPASQSLGTLNYNMQGAVSVVPNCMKHSASLFKGSWNEAGALETIGQAVELVKAWLLEAKEVDDLPPRHTRRYMI